MRRGCSVDLGALAQLLDQLLDLLLARANASIEVRQDPERMRTIDTPKIVADCSKLRRRTGWQPRIPFEKTLADVLDYWRAQVQTEGR